MQPFRLERFRVGSDFVISVYRKDFTKSEPPLKREVIIFFAFLFTTRYRSANLAMTQTYAALGYVLSTQKPNAVEIRRTQAVAAMTQTYAALG